MPKYRFDLPINTRRANVDDVVSDAQALGGVSNTTPRLKLLSVDSWQYQVDISDIEEADASYLILKHDLTKVRIDYDVID